MGNLEFVGDHAGATGRAAPTWAMWLGIIATGVVVAIGAVILIQSVDGGAGRGGKYQLPDTVLKASRPVREAYEFALARPDVLEWMDCPCGCLYDGHQHNRHCFVAEFGADGAVTLDPHGLT